MNDLQAAHYIAIRRDNLSLRMPHCPACNDEQVQLVDWMSVPAHWRCRICKERFLHEPDLKKLVLDALAAGI